jgi:hypothetical protein
MSEDEALMVREQLARIDQLTADAALKRQEFELGYRKFWATAIGAAAAVIGAAGAAGGLIVALLTHVTK